MIAATAAPSLVASACLFDKFTATATAQIQQVAACATAVGDITIQGSDLDQIDLTGVHAIFGSVNINNVPQINQILAPDLQTVSKDFEVVNATVLKEINLAQLTTVGSLSLKALSQLDKLELTTGLTSADSVVIADTGLSSLEGIDVYELKNFDVNNNPNIEKIKSDLKLVTGLLSISYNSQDVDVALDQLTSVADLNLQAIKSFSAKNLTSVNGTLSLIGTSVKDFELDNVELIQKSLAITENSDLTQLNFTKLNQIGGALTIGDNDKLKSFDSFPKLTQIGGSVNLTGSFDKGDFPELKRVAGGFELDSDGDLTCDAFQKLNSNSVIKGDEFKCKAKQEETSSSSSKAGNSSGVATSSSTGDSAAEETSSSSSGSGSGSGSDSKSSSSGSESAKSSGSSSKSGASGVSGKLALFAALFVAVGAALF